MKILVFNSGSSSLKFCLFQADGQNLSRLASGLLEKIGSTDGCLHLKVQDGKRAREEKSVLIRVETHSQAVDLAVEALEMLPDAIFPSIRAITAVGHRVVHGGEHFVAPALIDATVLNGIKQCIPLAPLHNPINLEGINAAGKLLPNIPHVAVFDTAFHQSMPEAAFLYALPYALYQEHHIRRYGFHGTSHKSVFFQAADFLDTDPSSLNAITCHLGNGASLCAISGGRVVDTSMGFTPLEGLVMGTRCGDMDPAVIFYLAQKCGYSLEEIETLLNNKSGILGLSEISNDMREVLNAAERGKEAAARAMEIYTRRIIKYIGAYTSVMNGVSTLVFTAGIGEYATSLRLEIMKRLSWLNILPDETANAAALGTAARISHRKSAVEVLVIPTDEEKEIAVQTRTLFNQIAQTGQPVFPR